MRRRKQTIQWIVCPPHALYYNWHRHYNPATGRYTQPDPLRFVDGPSVYAYAGSSPATRTDPKGLSIASIGNGFRNLVKTQIECHQSESEAQEPTIIQVGFRKLCRASIMCWALIVGEPPPMIEVDPNPPRVEIVEEPPKGKK